MVAAVREHEHLLPNGKSDMKKVTRDIAILASFPPQFFDKAAAAVMADWRSNNLGEMADYFEPTWLRSLRGWNVAFLGQGPITLWNQHGA